MKRYLSLFLILLVLFCYSGFRPDAFATPVKASGDAQSKHLGCHGMAQESEEGAPETELSLLQESPESASSCCFESLVNASLDQNPAVRTLVCTIPIQMLEHTPGQTVKVRDVASKEHSPPGLEISNSSLLL
jgi:hypothetical protein